jgi:hypothetical protein
MYELSFGSRGIFLFGGHPYCRLTIEKQANYYCTRVENSGVETSMFYDKNLDARRYVWIDRLQEVSTAEEFKLILKQHTTKNEFKDAVQEGKAVRNYGLLHNKRPDKKLLADIKGTDIGIEGWAEVEITYDKTGRAQASHKDEIVAVSKNKVRDLDEGQSGSQGSGVGGETVQKKPPKGTGASRGQGVGGETVQKKPPKGNGNKQTPRAVELAATQSLKELIAHQQQAYVTLANLRTAQMKDESEWGWAACFFEEADKLIAELTKEELSASVADFIKEFRAGVVSPNMIQALKKRAGPQFMPSLMLFNEFLSKHVPDIVKVVERIQLGYNAMYQRPGQSTGKRRRTM